MQMKQLQQPTLLKLLPKPGLHKKTSNLMASPSILCCRSKPWKPNCKTKSSERVGMVMQTNFGKRLLFEMEAVTTKMVAQIEKMQFVLAGSLEDWVTRTTLTKQRNERVEDEQPSPVKVALTETMIRTMTRWSA
jgi:hypothetical protein